MSRTRCSPTTGISKLSADHRGQGHPRQWWTRRSWSQPADAVLLARMQFEGLATRLGRRMRRHHLWTTRRATAVRREFVGYPVSLGRRRLPRSVVRKSDLRLGTPTDSAHSKSMLSAWPSVVHKTTSGQHSPRPRSVWLLSDAALPHGPRSWMTRRPTLPRATRSMEAHWLMPTVFVG